MTQFQKISLIVLRLSTGWMFLYAGITKVVNPEWSAAGYLSGAKMFVGFYNWLLGPGILPTVNLVNEWGLSLLGISLILGIGVRLSSALGVLLMLLYYIPLGFPYPNPNSFIVDQHVILIFVLLYFASIKAGRVFGLENWCSNLPICSKFPRSRNWLG